MTEKMNGAAQGEKKVTKMDAVRGAMAKLGRDAKPLEMQTYIKKTYGIDMSTDHISTYKGDIRKKKAKKSAAPAVKAAHTPTPQTPTRAQPAAGDSVLLEDVLTAKGLLDRVGAQRLRRLIDGLAK